MLRKALGKRQTEETKGVKILFGTTI
jgi:hypothetical protein